MTWNFDDLVKGQVTQTLFRTVLESFGYRVHPMGVEVLVPELETPDGNKIRSKLPQRLRFLPDFLVIDQDSGETYLTEIKFRRTLSVLSLRSVQAEIEQRRPFWPEVHTVLMIAEPRESRGFHQDHVRVVPADLQLQTQPMVRSPWAWWGALPHLQEVFRKLHGSYDHQQKTDSITQPLRDLAKIERPKTLDEKLRDLPGL